MVNKEKAEVMTFINGQDVLVTDAAYYDGVQEFIS